MGYFTRTKPGRDVRDEQAVISWLSTHRPLPCPPGTALGLSAMEQLTGIIANDGKWTEKIRFQQNSEVQARKNLLFGKLSRS